MKPPVSELILLHSSSVLLSFFFFFNIKQKLHGEEKMWIWRRNRNKCLCSVREINAHTIEFKKRWHIYCNINVIYIVFFLLKKTENSNSCCRIFWCASTIPFDTRTNLLSINNGDWRIMEVALLGIWSSYKAF